MRIAKTSMTDEHRKSVAIEYLKRLDRGESFFDLFADDAQAYFPKWGLANGRQELEELFSDLSRIISSIRHDFAYCNFIIQANNVVVEGTSYETTVNGKLRDKKDKWMRYKNTWAAVRCTLQLNMFPAYSNKKSPSIWDYCFKRTGACRGTAKSGLPTL